MVLNEGEGSGELTLRRRRSAVPALLVVVLRLRRSSLVRRVVGLLGRRLLPGHVEMRVDGMVMGGGQLPICHSRDELDGGCPRPPEPASAEMTRMEG